jgi:hypothetical protein
MFFKAINTNNSSSDSIEILCGYPDSETMFLHGPPIMTLGSLYQMLSYRTLFASQLKVLYFRFID